MKIQGLVDEVTLIQISKSSIYFGHKHGLHSFQNQRFKNCECLLWLILLWGPLFIFKNPLQKHAIPDSEQIAVKALACQTSRIIKVKKKFMKWKKLLVTFS